MPLASESAGVFPAHYGGEVLGSHKRPCCPQFVLLSCLFPTNPFSPLGSSREGDPPIVFLRQWGCTEPLGPVLDSSSLAVAFSYLAAGICEQIIGSSGESFLCVLRWHSLSGACIRTFSQRVLMHGFASDNRWSCRLRTLRSPLVSALGTYLSSASPHPLSFPTAGALAAPGRHPGGSWNSCTREEVL